MLLNLAILYPPLCAVWNLSSTRGRVRGLTIRRRAYLENRLANSSVAREHFPAIDSVLPPLSASEHHSSSLERSPDGGAAAG